jgi:hypothetical protein
MIVTPVGAAGHAHALAAHEANLGHAPGHAVVPQCVGSVAVSVHTVPPQIRRSGAPHVHAPATHVSPAAHA